MVREEGGMVAEGGGGTVLIDCGATHNFSAKDLVNKLQYLVLLMGKY